jgi:peptide deformylase
LPVREVLRYPHRALKTLCQPVPPDQAQAVASDLLETMRAHEGCVGLAAPQLGELVRVIVVDVSEHPKAEASNGLLTLVNPLVVKASGAHVAREGCLSIPHLTANVRRATSIALEAMTPAGEALALTSEGFEARCLLHEIDHLDGILFLDRVDSLSRDVFRRRRFVEAGRPEEPAAARAVVRTASLLTKTFGDGNFDRLAELFTDDVELKPTEDFPDPGPFRGRDAVEGILASFLESWGECRVDVETVLAAGDDRAVARLQLSGRGSGSGVEAADVVIGAFWLRDGRVERLELGRSAEAALAATGLPPSE